MFTDVIQRLRELPIPIECWKDEQVGFENGGPYKESYPKIKVNESTEPLVDVGHYGIVSSDYYLDQLLLGDKYLSEAFFNNFFWSRALLRETHVLRLAKVDAFLRKEGLYLFVASGWRHPSLQVLVTNNYISKHGELAAKKLFAPVCLNQAPPPHSTGAAFDVELWSVHDQSRIEMYYTHESRSIYSAYELEKMIADDSVLKNIKMVEAAMNRRILFHVLCTQGVVFDKKEHVFCNHPGEFWHFGDGDPLSAFLNQQDSAKYGLAFPQLHLPG